MDYQEDKTEYTMEGAYESTYKEAVARVEASAALNAHRDVLLDYDWLEGAEHYAWVASMPEADLISWAEAVKEN